MYYFRDYDDCLGDLQIADSNYTELIMLCCFYSEYVSMAFTSEEQIEWFARTLHVEKCEIIDTAKYRRKFRCFFKSSKETERFLLSHVNEFFQWVDFDGYSNPEDLTFYRKDGSVFFWSETHEGICAFFNRADENITSIISKPGWKHHDPQNGDLWGIPIGQGPKTTEKVTVLDDKQ